MSIDLYLQLDGIPGDSASVGHEGWIPLTEFDWSLTQSTGGGPGGLPVRAGPLAVQVALITTPVTGFRSRSSGVSWRRSTRPTVEALHTQPGGDEHRSAAGRLPHDPHSRLPARIGAVRGLAWLSALELPADRAG